MTIYEKINELCERNHISRHKLEMTVGLSNGSILSWKNHAPSTNGIRKIAEYFGVSISYLTGDGNHAVRIPVYASIPAGIPLEAISEVVDFEEITEDMSTRGEYFGIKVKGNSMEPELRTGDTLIVRCQPSAETGDIVVAGINGSDACVKKLIYVNGSAILQPLNPSYPPIVTDDLVIYGKVVEVRRRF